MKMMNEDDEGFNLIQPTLIQQLKTILDQYPDDGQILKELIQNAEDARATQVKFLHDLHSYGTEKLHSEGLAQFQGPALYAYNNAKFIPDDWKGIRMLCDSIKVKDPMKVGRFGLGFKSVFHITDLPSILSGSQIGVIDPHEEFFTERRNRRTGYSWRMKNDLHIMENIPDQFAPYKGIFDCTDDVFSRGCYNGTLFRFPLRHRPSELSPTHYSAEKVHTLFEGFMADAHLILLFLQHLESIELYVREEHDNQPRKTFQVRITDESLRLVREKREEFHNKISTGSLLPHPVQVTYPIKVETVHFSQGSETTKSHSFLVTNYFCGEEISPDFQTLAKDQSLSYLPLVGVAMALPTSPSEPTPEIQGHVFCVLPLPVQKTSLTGLPVHVNGFFALSQNRRYIKSPNAEQEDQELTDKSLLWNRCLLKEALPKAYAAMLLEAINEKSYNIQEETVYRAWPNIDAIDQKWKRLQNPLLEILCSANVVYTKANGGKWLKVEDAVLDRLDEHQPKDLLVSVLLEGHQNVATLPDYVLKAFTAVSNKPFIKEITPMLVRQILKESLSSYRNHGRMEKLKLLAFILNCIDENFADLVGLELLPVSSGAFKCFASPSNCDEAIYVCSPDHPRKMFPCLHHQFLDQNLDQNLLEMMEKAARKGCTQLKLLTKEDMASLLSNSLPPEWSQGETILWYHGSDSYNHPGLDWLELVWNYLRANFATNDELRGFTGLPLIPHEMSQVPISLARLQQPSKIVLKSLYDESFDETLIQALKHLGLVIIQECPSYLTLHPAVINAFIYPPSPDGVLKALSACSSVVESNKHSLTDEGKRSLRKFFSKESSLEPQAKQLLRTLPVFETLNKSFVSAEADLCAAPPEDSYPVAPRRVLIDVTHHDSKRLAHLLDIRFLSPVEFFLEIVFPDVRGGNYSNGEIDRIMGFVMDRFQVFASEDARFEEALTNLPFVASENRRERAMDLFDPGVELLKRMLAEEDVFPVGEQYTNPTALVVLKKLGMKSEKEISAEDLYRSARKISQMPNLEEAKQKSATILSYLESYSTKLQQTVSGVTLTQLLKDVPWVSEVSERPFGVPVSLFSTEETSKAHFYKPTEVTSEDRVNLIGTVKPIVRVDSSSQLAKCFGWDKMPDVLDVVQHLRTVVTHYTQDKKPYYISVVKDIYSFLDQTANFEVIKEVLQRIENSIWIWNGDGFSSPDVVLAARPPIDLTPYICSLPSEVLQFSNLFSKFGMREHCDALLFVKVLQLIKQKYESGHEYPSTEVKRDLQLSADILNEIKPNVGEQLPSEIQEKVLIPTHVEGDSYVRLAPIKDCMYCDHEWLEDGIPAEEENHCFFVHQNISNSTAELFQVRTLRNQLLEADEIGDEFGQEEKLTRRLNKLLEEYTDGFSVPKELIQNADDAGATEVRFLYDERTNEDAMTCLIDEGMKECQGPALWVYNDAEFRDEDFENITKLNGGTKKQETEKIGKFGLGFNTVYNLTDVPMFLSRNYFVIFDPNTFYLGKAIKNKSKPGIKIDVNKNPERKRRLRNQFKPFNGIFGCDLLLDKKDNSFQGTLFRFPLRTKRQALTSEIKQDHYGHSQMRELLEIFVRGAKTLLLFTQNVRQVTIFHLPRDSTEQTQPKLMFQVTKALSHSGIMRELSVPMKLPLHQGNVSTDDLHLLKQSNFLRASSQVLKHNEDTKETNDYLLRSAITINIKATLTECGRLFFDDKISLHNSSEVWFVASSMGKGQAMQFSVNDRSLLPAAAVAVKLLPQESQKFVPEPVVSHTTGGKSYHNGSVFCYLPLPIHSGLPVHINGTFAVASNRRHLKQKTEDDKACAEVEWNNVLFKDSVCSAYLDLLEDMKTTATTYCFHSLWPRACDIEPYFEPLARSFYQKVASGDYSLFSDGDTWVGINQVVFLEPYFRHDQRVGDISVAVLQKMVAKQEVVVDLPVEILQSFIDYGLGEKIQLKAYDRRRFFRELFFPNIGFVPADKRDELILFALDDSNGEFDELIKSYACIPASPKGKILKRPMELVHPNKSTASLFHSEDEKFPFGTTETFLDSVRLAKLEQLGMKAEKGITADDLYHSANNIPRMVKSSEAKQKSENIMTFLDSNPMILQQNVSGQPLALLLRDIPWISVMEEMPFGLPKSLYSLVKDREVPFYKPTEVTSKDKVNLVGTVKPIVRVDSSSHLAKCFGWDKMPDALDVVQHLKTVVSHYTPDEKQYYISIVKDIYSFLDQAADSEGIEVALEGIKNSNWIWNGDGFSSPDAVLAERPPIDLTPFISSLPSEVVEFSNLFSKFGMSSHCDALFLVQILHVIKKKYESGLEYRTSDVKRDLQLCADILNEIKPNVGKQLALEIQEKVLIPTHVEGDSYVRLAPVKDCMYCDHEWIEDSTPVDEERYFFVHPNIPNSTAELLQVRTLRNQLLEADEIGDEFGQEEKLTCRLNRLLEEYTDGFSVPKELIQNADDAGATEVRFLYDERANEDAMTCLIDEGMKECQGSALWVYNDAEFKDEDFRNIIKLNGSSKRQENEKIGKFGLGFNTVYNLTDVPMFLSRNYFVIFDPNTFYLGKAIKNKSKPGIKIDVNKNPERKRRLRNQFKPFNGIFGCDLLLDKKDNSFQGTLFRFPLRTKRQALTSEIKQDHYGHSQMRELLEIFVRGAKTLLLFTQNVRQVTIFHLPRDSTEQTQPKLMFQVTKALSHSGIMRELSFPMKLPLHQSNVSTDDLHLLTQSNFLRASSQVLKHNEDTKETNDYLLRSAITINIKATLTECGRLFFDDKISLHNSSEVWFVASSMGKGQAMQFSVNDRSLLPAAAVAVKLLPQESQKFVPEPVVSHTTEGKSYHNGSVFCYLPLPIHSGLPVHINGTFAVASNRRHLKQKTEDDKACAEVEWNNVLFKDSVCSAYLDLLEDMKTTATTYCFHSLWPRACDIEPYFEPLARSFYQKVASGDYSLFSDGDTWVGINQVVFLEPYFRHDQRVGDISVAVLQKMVAKQEVVVDLPVEILQSFIDYGLGEKIQLKAYDRRRFFRELFFPNIGFVPADKRDELILFALDDSNGEFDELIKSYACIPASPKGKILKRPMELVHPNKSTASLFHSEDEKFPFGTTETFLDSVRLAKLEQLGMKAEKGITADDLYHSANNIPRMVKSSEAKQKSENIMTFLDSNPMILQQNVSGQPLALLLRDIPWISVMEEMPFGLPKSLYSLVKDREVPFYKPTEVTSKDKVNLVGTVKPIVRVDSSSHLAKCFGWDKMPDALDVVQHLKTVVSHYTPDEKQYYISIVKDIYSFLDQAADSEGIEVALEGIKNSNWIWNGDGFSSPDAVLAERPPIDLTPFISSLPSEVTQFSNLFLKFGMSSHCDALFLVQILHVIKKKYESGLEYRTSDVKRDLQLCADILNEIKPNVGKQLALEIQEKVLIPTHVEGDSYVRLAPVKDCMYCDHEWIEDSTPVDEEREYFFVHPNIPNNTAELLQVRTLRNQLLEADEIGDEFGQEEKLTCRLNRLLEEYTDGFSVPKELIQNADDAGATEVRFLYDERANEDAMTCLIDEGMKECQGSALWVYNDAEFKDEDFRNIIKLNGSSKEQENEKIGMFGLGFNTVYNLTDVPMFLSRNHFVIFDPNTFYLGKAIKNKSKPGIKIDVNKNPERKRRFRNQFKPFNGIFGCDLRMNKADNSFPGTLFRFPLRTKAQAVRSEIKQVHYDNNQMKELLEIFVRGAKKLLLFTQNVRRVSIFHLLGESSEPMQPTLMFQVTKSLSETGICRELSFPLTLPSHLGNLCKDEQYLLKQSNFLRASSEVAKHARDSTATRDYLLRSAFTFNITSNVTECGRFFFEDKSPPESIAEVWFIASSMGKGQAMQYSLNDRSLLPAAAVAVQLITQENEKFAPKAVVRHATGGKSHHNGTVFCYLPLPIHSGLPVHINGAFAVASNRRDLKQKTEDDKACAGVEWNNVLFTDSVCEAYLDLLEDMKSRATMYSFHTLWPKACDMEPCCEPLVRSFYQQVATGGYSLFSDGNRWVDISQVVCLDPYFRQDKDVGGISYAVLQMLVSKDKVVIDLPVDIFQSFVKYGLEEHIRLTTYDKGRFLRELFFSNIQSIPQDMRDKLVLNALDDTKGQFDELIATHACIPASPRGKTLKCPAELIHPKKATASLFQIEDEKFPFGTDDTFLDCVRLTKLEQLGMVADDPPWGMFEERAKSVGMLNEESSKGALERAKALISLLERKLYPGAEVPEGVQENLLQIRFLPVSTKPEHFPLFWKGGDLRPEKRAKLVSPEEAFVESTMYLVCCSEQLVDGNIYISSTVKKFLQLDKKATIKHIITQLEMASCANHDLNSVQFEQVKTTSVEAYKYLQAALNENQIDENEVRGIFEEKKFILAGREFVDSKHVAFEMPVDCSPYLYKLPEDLAKQFGNLMTSVGVKQVHEASDFLSSLEQIKRAFGDAVLEKKILQAAVHLACQLGKCITGCCVSDGKQQTIYLPDSQGIMRPVSKLCIKDCSWISDEKDVYYADSMIPHLICLKLGVKTRRAEALSPFAVGIPFGQKEKLTNRLQRLLQAYPCEKEILKELLQNADDAEATEICFIKDPRQHPDERVFEDSWKPLQGPALCVYNNKPFTEADIKGIQNLGEGSKGDDPNKTGQYGVGFNAVYHLTDVPSFASCGDEIGDVLCVFDPNCKYVPGATEREPGRMFRETTKLRGDFVDVFSCYNEDHFSLRNATMFRFPLRTEEMAKDSKISNSPITLETLQGMMESLKTELFEVLLFVNNVKKITMCDIDDSGQVVNSYFVKVEMSEEDSLERQTFASYVKHVGRLFKQHPERSPIQAEVKKCSYVLTLKDSMDNEEKWLIVQQIGFENHVKESIIDAYGRNDLGMLPRGGVACLLDRKSASAQRTEGKKKVYCFLPLPIETDLPLHINGHFALDHEARRSLDSTGGYKTEWNNFLLNDVIASCYLTLLDKVRRFYSLPVSQSPEEISLSRCKDELAKNVKEYEKLFPCAISSNQYWATLVTSVYQGMDQKRLRLLPVLRGDTKNGSTPSSQLAWLPLTGDGKEKAFFNNLTECDCFTPNFKRPFDEIEMKRKIKEKALFENILLKTEFNLVAFSVSVCKAAHECGVQTSFVSPSAVMDFYKSFSGESPLCSIGSLFVDLRDTPFKDVQTVVTVLKYCKESDSFPGHLPGLPLLVTQDNHLQPFNAANRKFLSRHHLILPQCKEMFVHDHIRTHIFGDAKSLDASVFKHFDVESFAANLHRALPQEYLNSNQYVKWNPRQVSEPNGDWVYRVWRFLDEQIENVLREERKKENEMANDIQVTRTSATQVTQQREVKETGIIRIVLKPLSKFSILPCTETTPLPKSSDGNASGVVVEHYLVPLSLSESVLDFTSLDATSKFLVEALRKLSLPELNRAVLSSTVTSAYTSINCGLARRLVATINSPKFLLFALCQKITRNPNSLHGNLNSDECRTILEHFSNSVKDLEERHKLPLRKLPLYETTDGGQVSLESRRVCVVPVEVPHDGMDVFRNESDVIFLKSCSNLSPLYQFLEFESVSSVDIYCNYILKSFSLFSSQARLAHLEYIRDIILKQRSTEETDKKRLLHCLTNTGIIASRDGTLLQASCYFDLKHVVFKTMLSEDMFPPKPFDDEWLPFLRSIGLVHEVSQDLFKRFAMEVAREGSTTHTDKTDKKSEVLVTHLYSREDVVQEGLLRAILDIRFVAPAPLKPELREICPPYGAGDIGHTPYIPFRGSVLARHADIVWTTAAVLSKWANPKRHVGEMNATGWKSKTDYCNAIIANLKILEEPTVEQVTFHCQNVSFQMEKENESDLPAERVASRMSVMRNIYQFFEARAIHTTFTKERLRHTPCIVVEGGKRVVKALQVVIELEKNLEIRPFLYSLPGELCQFKIFFQYLGCAPSVEPSHFAMVLDMLQDNCKKNRLEPNEIEKALKAEKSIFEALEDYPESLQDLSSLYLPAMRPFAKRLEDTAPSIFLCNASELLFDDAPYYHDRLGCFEQLFVVDLKRANVRCSPSHIYKDLIMLLPHAVRPQLLSHAVEEQFANSRSKTAIFDVGAASLMKKTLHSEQFSRGIIRLIRHACHKHQVEVDESVVTLIEGRLKTTEIHGVSRIETNLVHDGKVITGSEMEVPFYLEKVCRSGEENWSLYVNVADDVEETLSTIAMVLADVIAEACNGLLRETAMFIPEMLQSQPGKISSLLDKRKIRPDDAYDSKKGDVYPQPGDFIPIEDHHLLNPEFGTFYPGEYVGYEVEDPSLHLEDGDATYIYAVIIEEICPDIDTDPSIFCRNYRINIGSDKTPVVQATELYKFYRPREVISTAVALTDQQDSTHAPNEKQHIFQKITEVLEEAWKLSEDKRRQVVKRLFLQWHPDKNPGNEEFCTEVFLFIKSEIERLERLEGARRRESGSSESFDYSGSYGAYFGFWGTRARHYSSRRQTYREAYYQHYGSRDPGTRTWEVPPSFCTTNPQPRQAKRWFRQAEADLKAVVNDMNSVNPSYEWACLKSHQAAEKALKAAQYAVDAFKTNVHNLIQNSLMLDDSRLITLSSELENLVGDSTCMRYPDRLDFPKIPNDVYKESDARQAEKVAREIVEKVRSRVF